MASEKSDDLMISFSLLASFPELWLELPFPPPSSSLYPIAPRHAPSIPHCLRQQLAKDGGGEASLWILPLLCPSLLPLTPSLREGPRLAKKARSPVFGRDC